MAVYAIIWQFNSLHPDPKAQEQAVIDALKEFEAYHDEDLRKVWFISTTWKLERVHRHLYKYVHGADRLFIMRIKGSWTESIYGGEMPQRVWDWIGKQN